MKVVNFGDTYQIYKDSLKTYNNLPPATYKVSFNPMQGFSLVKVDNFVNREDKIYGNHEEKVNKIIRSYDSTDRSLGVILSGDKGMGKSLFVNLLGEAMIEKGMPVIICQDNYPGISDFIESIKQDALFIFDEYEKNFPINGDGETQNKMLSLFDGLSQTKRMYAITVNKLRGLSDFILNRTGRFHYHLRFNYPTQEELYLYMKDKVKEEYHSEIKNVAEFATRIRLNYDTLRSIAFELNLGYGFKESIGDMNIIQKNDYTYDVEVKFAGYSETIKIANRAMDTFGAEEVIAMNGPVLKETRESIGVEVTFDPSKATLVDGVMLVDGKDVQLEAYDSSDKDNMKYVEVEYITYKLSKTANLHYNL